MLALLILLILGAMIALAEGPALFKARKWRELSTFGVLLFVALLIGAGKALGMPTPVELLERWLRPLGKALLGSL